MMLYKKTLEYIRKKGGIVIADIKRGDISATAKMYAKAHFEGDFESDFITLNPYMGMDTLEPYSEYFKNKEKGAFLLLRTSNKGSKDIQYLDLKDNKKVYNKVGEKIENIGKEFLGKYGYSSIGAVVGCTAEENNIRQELKHTFVLIPGYGAQGGKADVAKSYLSQGNGGIVNSSRGGILLAYKKYDEEGKNFEEYAREEVISMKKTLQFT